MLLRQFLDPESNTFTYLVAENYNTPAVIIDPVLEHIKLYNQFIQELGLTLTHCIETHTHADHVTASGTLASIHGCQIVVGEHSKAQPVDMHMHDLEKFNVGKLEFTALYTPGHTDDSYCYACEDALFTGDTLLIRGTGRTDFQSGSSQQAYNSITQKLFAYPDHTRIYPGHDYKVVNVSTIGEEKRFNPRLQVDTAAAYADIMDHLKLAYPKKIDIAVPANLRSGLLENEYDTK